MLALQPVSAPLRGRHVWLLGLTLVAWAIHRPGVFAHDSLISWYDEHRGFFDSYQPPFLGVLWNLLDKLGSGASLLIVLSLTMFSSASYLIARTVWRGAGALVATAGVLLLPQVFSQLSIINKETIGGNALLLAAGLLIRWGRSARGTPLLLAAAALAGFAVLTRYQFAIAVLPLFATCLAYHSARLTGWAHRVRDFGRSAALATLGFVAVIALAATAMTQFYSINWGASLSAARRYHVQYELAALIHADPSQPLPILEAGGANVAAIREEASASYTPDTNIPLFRAFFGLFEGVPTAAIERQVDALADARPGTLTRHHLFGFLALLAVERVCWPVQDRILVPRPGQEEQTWAEAVGLSALQSSPATTLLRARLFPAKTFLFRPVVYLGLAAVMLGVALVFRRSLGVAREVVPLCGSGIVYLLSFVSITPSCDFRYAYWLVVTTIFAALVFLGTLPRTLRGALSRR